RRRRASTTLTTPPTTRPTPKPGPMPARMFARRPRLRKPAWAPMPTSKRTRTAKATPKPIANKLSDRGRRAAGHPPPFFMRSVAGFGRALAHRLERGVDRALLGGVAEGILERGILASGCVGCGGGRAGRDLAGEVVGHELRERLGGARHQRLALVGEQRDAVRLGQRRGDGIDADELDPRRLRVGHVLRPARERAAGGGPAAAIALQEEHRGGAEREGRADAAAGIGLLVRALELEGVAE